MIRGHLPEPLRGLHILFQPWRGIHSFSTVHVFFGAFWRTVYCGVLKAQTKHANTPSRVGQVGFGFGVLTHPPNNLGSISDSQQLFSITVGEDKHLQEPGRLWGAGDCWRKSAFPMVHPSNFRLKDRLLNAFEVSTKWLPKDKDSIVLLLKETNIAMENGHL